MMRPYMLCVVGQPEDEVLDRHGAKHAPPTLMVACGEEIEVACSCREARGLGGSTFVQGQWRRGHERRQHRGRGGAEATGGGACV